ncbi:MAG: BMP family ABC transporter substrate-binding protein, partial [Lachnospiraceae bacterium]|nr:BMP family ABC transporter substrate-binding protein [Lachnospiraceae bacterium]
IGTSTKGRTYAFAANFMPILETGTEFSYKWANLADAQVDEGIRDPIIAYEYMNRFYVVEGNKRASVLKYYNAVSISAIVTRKIPKYSEDEHIKIYYEFMKFNEITGLNTIEFTRLGKAQQLLEFMGKTEPWDEETREDFSRVVFRFSNAYKAHGGDKLPITIGDALVAFMNVFEYEEMLTMTESDFRKNIIKIWTEFIMLTEKQRIGLVMDPKKVHERKSLLRYFIPEKKLTVAFLYPKTPEESDWTYAHNLGQSYLEDSFPEKINTICVQSVNEENVEDVLNEVIKQGANIIFGTAPQMMKPSLKVAIEHPDVTVLNCSLNAPHKSIRTYYARMYEAKFVSGMVAGAMAENDKIAYIADYPIYGMIANINAFALGASCVNPRAKIYLDWSTRKDYDLDKFLTEHDIHYVSNQDMITPISPTREFGLYRYENGEATNLVMPLWNWGIFYEKMMQSILAGTYKSEGDAETKAINYWWGMSAGVIDLICSKHVPKGVQRLAEHMKYDISVGDVLPFFGEIYAQDGSLKNKDNEAMSPSDIMEMDWLVENVIGDIPTKEEVIEGAKPVVELQGVEENK